jgi:hypothetical protein
MLLTHIQEAKSDAKVRKKKCTVTEFLDIIHLPVYYLKQCFGDWIVSPSSGKSLLSWAFYLKTETEFSL